MILVTGAAGKTGRAIIHALSRRRAPVRAFVRRPEQVALVRPLGPVEVIVGDLMDREDVAWAARGASTVYHICPNVNPREVEIGSLVIAAARDGGARRVVYHSVLHPSTGAMPHHALKARVEVLVGQSGLPHVILRPASYMQNVLAGWRRVVTDGIYPVPYALSTRLGPVDLDDVAEAAALVLTEPGHDGRVYELAGPDVLDQTETAAIMSRVLGRPVESRVVPHDVWEREARAAGLSDYQVETLLAMFRFYEAHGFWGQPDTLASLLGRPPSSFAAFLERTARGGAVNGRSG